MARHSSLSPARSWTSSHFKLRLALVLIACSIGVHSYLTWHHYQNLFGSSGPSICSVNAKFDCDVVDASSYSELLGFPLALWGVMTHVALLLAVFGTWLMDDEAKERWRFVAVGLTVFTALMSVVMGWISVTQMNTYCLFCISAYFFSFLTLATILAEARQNSRGRLWQAGLSLLRHRGALIMLALVPFGVWVVHQMVMQNMAGGNLANIVQPRVQEWSAERQYPLVFQGPTLSLGADLDKAQVRLVEFADFRCPHCKEAGPGLHRFVLSHPDVRLEFITFPLDGECNAAIKRADGVSCKLAKLSYCALLQGKGWPMHDAIFESQGELRTLDDIDRILQPKASELGLNWQNLSACITDPTTHDQIVARAKIGAEAGLEGTPTIFVNGRKLNGAQFLPILQSAYKEAKAK